MLTLTPCPEKDVLERLLLGYLAPEVAEALEAHVLACSHCAHAFQTLRTEDGLVAALRQVQTVPVMPAAAEAMIPWLKRLRPKESAPTLGFGDAATPDPTTTLPMFDFLAKPEQADEVGRLGKYRVLQSIGVGGMGMVFRAEDVKLKRQVALKVIKPDLIQRADLHARFLCEAQAIAQVEHDNIVAVYDANDEAGIPYLVMPLLLGESLEETLRKQEGPLPIDDILSIGREIAAGLAAAHERNLIHRDIKPSNIWLEERYDPPSASLPAMPALLAPSLRRVKILDFGLARSIDGFDDEGEQRSILGTPAYMSPEQGRCAGVDARTDLFSLGCVMYRMATGHLPFKGQDVITTLMSVATSEPVSPKKLNPKLPLELVALIDKLLAKKPEQRYKSAQEVVEAIQALERARQPKVYRRWLLLIAASILVAVVGSFGLFSYFHPTLPPVDPCEVTLLYDEPDSLLLVQHEDDPPQEIDVKATPKLMLLPGEYSLRPKKEAKDRKLWPERIVVNAQEPKVVPLRLVGAIRSYGGHTRSITGVAFSPRPGSFLALTSSLDRSLGLWNTNADDPALFLEDVQNDRNMQTEVYCVAFSSDGKQAISGSGLKHKKYPDNSLRVWDIEQRCCFAPLAGHASAVKAVAYDPKGKILLSGDQDGKVFFWDAHTHQLLKILPVLDRETVQGLAILPDGKHALACGNLALLLLDIANRHFLKSIGTHAHTISAVCAAPDGKQAATASSDGLIRIWDLETGACLRTLKGDEKSVHCVAYSPDGQRILSGGRDGIVRLWDAGSGALIHAFFGHTQTVHGVAFAPDGRRAVSGGADRVMRLWELPK